MQTNQIIRICVRAVLISAPLHPLLAHGEAVQEDVVSANASCVERANNWYRTPSGMPFTAAGTSTSVTRNANGTTSTQVQLDKEARDSAGRMSIESRNQTLNCVYPPPVVSFTVQDPVKHITVSWSTRSTEAVLLHVQPETPELKERLKKWGNAPWTADATACGAVSAEWSWKIEKLGTKAILGVVAEGIRATGVAPVRNGQFVVTFETWYSTELQITLLNISDNPRDGRVTWEVTQLERTEPNPRLFQVPAGYTVIDRNPEKPDETRLLR